MENRKQITNGKLKPYYVINDIINKQSKYSNKKAEIIRLNMRKSRLKYFCLKEVLFQYNDTNRFKLKG